MQTIISDFITMTSPISSKMDDQEGTSSGEGKGAKRKLEWVWEWECIGQKKIDDYKLGKENEVPQ